MKQMRCVKVFAGWFQPPMMRIVFDPEVEDDCVVEHYMEAHAIRDGLTWLQSNYQFHDNPDETGRTGGMFKWERGGSSPEIDLEIADNVLVCIRSAILNEIYFYKKYRSGEWDANFDRGAVQGEQMADQYRANVKMLLKVKRYWKALIVDKLRGGYNVQNG